MSSDLIDARHEPYINVQEAAASAWPSFLPALPADSVLEHVWMQSPESTIEPGRIRFATKILIEQELELGVPGIDAVSLVVAAEDGGTVIPLSVRIMPDLDVEVSGVPIALRFDPSILKPVRPAANGQGYEVDPTVPHVEIVLARATLGIDGDGNMRFELDGGIDLPLCMVADSGVVIEAKGIALHLDDSPPPAGLPPGWRGVHLAEARLHLPGDLGHTVGELSLQDASIGNGGFSGTVEDTWTPGLAATLGGMQAQLDAVSLTFVQNAFTGSAITGRLTLPVFDEPVDVHVGFDLSGRIAIDIASADGLTTLHKPGVLDLELDSLGFHVGDGPPSVVISGKLTPAFGGLEWPSIDVQQLSIDADGNVHLPGGWLDLPAQYSIDFHGFGLEISKLGFGRTEADGRWFGVSGGLKLVDGLAAGASVDGLRVSWGDGGPPAVSFDGVGVELAVPGAFSFKGAVSYRELTVGGEDVHRFDGDIKLELEALALELDATLVIESAIKPDGEQYTFMAIYLACELPAGIPLGPTGLGLYGLAGLFALSMEPDKRPDEPWYGIGPGEGWYHRPQVGATDLEGKWVNREGSLALGAGVTLGTVGDNGFAFNGKLLLAIVFPGPIILMEGKANLLKERASLDDEPNFRALAVLDERAGSFLIGLDAQYKYGPGGELIDIHAGAEAYFASDPTAWHVWLGKKDPRGQRIRAQIFKLWEANAYLLLDAHGVATGAWVGYDSHYRFGPLSVDLEAWLSGDATVSFKPAHFSGAVDLHGKLGLRVFGFGFSISADALITADVFDPFHLLAQVTATLDLPWPLPNYHAHITLEWGPEPTPPPVPAPLLEVAVEHLKVTTSWPLPKGSLLAPAYDAASPGFLDDPLPNPATVAALPPPADAPVVPLDARPHVTFSRTVHDDALVGVNGQPVIPDKETIGDPAASTGPAEVRYAVTEVALDKWTGSAWTTVARKGTTANPAGVRDLFGSWAPVPDPADPTKVGQAKLWLWSKTPFDWSAHSTGTWDEWFTGAYSAYPCPVPPRKVTTCVDFAKVPVGPATSPLAVGDPPVVVTWPAGQTATITLRGDGRALCFARPKLGERPVHECRVQLPTASVAVEVGLVTTREVEVRALRADGTEVSPDAIGAQRVSFTGEGLIAVRLRSLRPACVVSCCYTVGPTRAEQDEFTKMAAHIANQTEVWSHTGDLLEPWTAFRLKVTTHTTATPLGTWTTTWGRDVEATQYAFFRTSGPPGIAALSVPIGRPVAAEWRSGLDALNLYVRSTVPDTATPPGRVPQLPRPAYRAYDLGVAFNEDYVDELYRLAGRDLELLVVDTNCRPVRNGLGATIVTANRWGHAATQSLRAAAELWTAVIDASSCATLDLSVVPLPVVLASGHPDHVLLPAQAHQARLSPLLLHESFASTARWTPAGGAWSTVADPAGGHAVTQTASTGPATNGPLDPGALLVLGPDPRLETGSVDQPGAWTDVRIATWLRPDDAHALGVVFRRGPAHAGYAFVVDQARRRRVLVRLDAAGPVVLAEESSVAIAGVDQLVVIEAIGSDLAVFLDGRAVFAVADAGAVSGGMALYAAGPARFSEVRVWDLRPDARTAYSFAFTTSRYASAEHHLHSHDDDVRFHTAPGLALTGPPSDGLTPVGEAEARLNAAYLAAALGDVAQQPAQATEVHAISAAGGLETVALRFAEPIDLARTTFELQHSPRALPIGVAPAGVKIVGARPAEDPADEHVDLLLRDGVAMDGHRVEHQRTPHPLAGPADPIVLATDFNGAGGLLFDAPVSPTAGQIIDDGASQGPSAWSAVADGLRQSSNIWGGNVSRDEPAKPGTTLVFGDADWGDVRISVRLRADTDDDALGLAFRRSGAADFYRFSMDRERGYRRLVRCTAGVFSVLWEDAVRYEPGRWYDLTVDAYGDHLVGTLDGEPLWDLHDATHRRGAVGLYCWAHQDARFSGPRVWALGAEPVLARPAWQTSVELQTAAASDAPTGWMAADGELSLSAPLGPAAAGLELGAFALAVTGREDVAVSARLRPTSTAAAALVVRYVDAANHVHLVVAAGGMTARVEQVVAGVVTTLASAPIASADGHAVALTVQGARLLASVDGAVIADQPVVSPEGRAHGVAVGDAGAAVTDLAIVDRTVSVAGLRVNDLSGAGGPSTWSTHLGILRQDRGIGDAGDASQAGTLLLTATDAPETCRVEAVLCSADDGAVGLVCRYEAANSHYRLTLDRRHNERRLVRVTASGTTVLWSSVGGYVRGRPFTLTLDAVGDTLTGYLDGVRLFSLIDGIHRRGRAGLCTWCNDRLRCTRLELQHPPQEDRALLRDAFATGSMAGWTIVDAPGVLNGPSAWAVSGGVLIQTSDVYTDPIDAAAPDKLATTAVAGYSAWKDVILRTRIRSNDDDVIGACVRYRDDANTYRFTMDSERGYRRLVKFVGGVCTVLWEDRVAFEVGRAYELVMIASGGEIRVLLDGLLVCGASDTDLSAGRIGLHCWANTGARFSDIVVLPAGAGEVDALLVDDFGRDRRGRWSYRAQPGSVGGPPKWSMSGGALRQTGHGGNAGNATPWQDGTLALAGDPTWSDYRLTVRLRQPTAKPIGIVARASDAEHFYGVTFDAGEVRLVRVAGASRTPLFQQAMVLDPAVSHTVTLDAQANRLTLAVDGVVCGSVDDDALPAGCVGVYAASNPDAEFEDLRVDAFAWEVLGRVDGVGVPLPAGTRIHLHADSPAVAPANTLVRTGVRPGETPRSLLTGEILRLRVVDGTGVTLHERGFLTDAAFTAVPALAVRAADGSSVALAPAAGPIEPGTLRVITHFQRDITAVSPSAPVLTREGNSDAEVATLEVRAPGPSCSRVTADA